MKKGEGLFFKIILILIAIFSLKTFSDVQSQAKQEHKEKALKLAPKQLEIIRSSLKTVKFTQK